MNKGRICISVQAPTIVEFVEQIKSANEKSSLIELRFDCLDPKELRADDVDAFNISMGKIFRAADPASCITTFRPKKFGGHREISDLERENFWNTGFETELADLEE